VKIFLAGADQLIYKVAIAEFHPYTLFSYHYFKEASDRVKKFMIEGFNRTNTEIICDSGLFTFMFGAAKGKSFPLSWWEDYARKYIETAKSWGFKNITLVECDVHKLLGMDATWKLRKIFENSGMQVLYVWHKEEGLDGLIKLCERYDYIALSVPELRVLFKGKEHSYRDAVRDLLNRIETKSSKIPKIHLLGNTVEELMKEHTPYSCDSTHWLAGVRWGSAKVFTNGQMKTVNINESLFQQIKKTTIDTYPESFDLVRRECLMNGRTSEHIINVIICARQFSTYQQYLDRNYQWVGYKRKSDAL